MLVRINHIGWIHLWHSRAAFEAGEASAHFFNPKLDPRWLDFCMPEEVRLRLEAGEAVEMEDPGYLDQED
ncbi:MAG: hypothetical protein Q8O00_02910 [Holophaga sp.]|nr:hypothetical protein [Holophaga sp.]